MISTSQMTFGSIKKILDAPKKKKKKGTEKKGQAKSSIQ